MHLFPPRKYASYADALASCEGYQSPDVIAVVLEKTVAYRDAPFATDAQAHSMAALLAFDGPDLHVLDFGGACGAHYFLARALLPESRKLHWHVVETPAMADAARSLEADGLRFHTSVSGAAGAMSRIDLAHASGALQYTPDPMASLRDLLAVKASRLLVTRMAYGLGVEIQRSRLRDNGPGRMPSRFVDREVRYPVTLMDASAVKGAIGARYGRVIEMGDGGLLAA